jgi:hypothetical protein
MELLLVLILIAVGGLPLLIYAAAGILFAAVGGVLICLLLGFLAAFGQYIGFVFLIGAVGLMCVGYYDRWRDPIGYKKRIAEIYGRSNY